MSSGPEADLDTCDHPTGIAVLAEEPATVRIRRHKSHGEWNYAQFRFFRSRLASAYQRSTHLQRCIWWKPGRLSVCTVPGYAAPGTTVTTIDSTPWGRRPGFQAGIDPVAMPRFSSAHRSCSLGRHSPDHPSGRGDPQSLGFVQRDYQVVAGNPVVTITEGSTVTTVTSVTDTPVGAAGVGTRLIQAGSTSTVVAGPGNGILYANGDISSLAGVIKGRSTVATNFRPGRIWKSPATSPATTPFPGFRLLFAATNSSLWQTRCGFRMTRSRYPAVLRHIFTSMRPCLPTSSGWWRVPRRGGFSAARFLEAFILGNKRPDTVPFSGTTVIAGMSGPTGNGTPRIAGDINMANDPPPLFPSSEQGKMVVRYWREQPLD